MVSLLGIWLHGQQSWAWGLVGVSDKGSPLGWKRGTTKGHVRGVVGSSQGYVLTLIEWRPSVFVPRLAGWYEIG